MDAASVTTCLRTVADAEQYLTNVPLASYAAHGFGLCMVELLEGAEPAGMCGHGMAREAASPVHMPGSTQDSVLIAWECARAKQCA